MRSLIAARRHWRNLPGIHRVVLPGLWFGHLTPGVPVCAARQHRRLSIAGFANRSSLRDACGSLQSTSRTLAAVAGWHRLQETAWSPPLRKPFPPSGSPAIGHSLHSRCESWTRGLRTPLPAFIGPYGRQQQLCCDYRPNRAYMTTGGSDENEITGSYRTAS